jgi:hypothetical protein
MSDKSAHDWWVELKFIWFETKWWVIRFWKQYIGSIPTRIRHRWHALWVRKDEFHKSLNLDIDYYSVLSKKDREIYMRDLVRRRELAHQRDLDRSN